MTKQVKHEGFSTEFLSASLLAFFKETSEAQAIRHSICGFRLGELWFPSWPLASMVARLLRNSRPIRSNE